MSVQLNIGIVGVTGYSGQTLLSLLLRHPSVSVRYLAARHLKRAVPVGSLLSPFEGWAALKVQPFQPAQAGRLCDLLFLALPNGLAMQYLPGLLKNPNLRVVDLSGDFRLHLPSAYRSAYHLKHRAPSLLRHAVYGLSELARKQLPTARIVANPGCYPTAALLGLAPLAEAHLIAPAGTAVDAKSGVTGAGRSLRTEMLYAEVNEDLRAYRVDAHPHTPEMEQTLAHLAARPIRIIFVPHLVPMNRGIYATIYAPVSKPLNSRTLQALYRKRYAAEPFVRVLKPGQWPKIRSVAGTNFCDIGVWWDARNRRAVILAAIDNLMKGAAGQAVQNMNLMVGFDEKEGLL